LTSLQIIIHFLVAVVSRETFQAQRTGGVTSFLVAVSYPNSKASIIIGLLVSAFNFIAIWRLAWDLLEISNEISEIEKAPTEVRTKQS